MVTRAEATQEFIRRAFCNVATGPGNLAALALLSGNPATGAAIIAAGAIGAAAVCNTTPPPQSNSPFQGGQCPKRYRYSWSGVVTRPPFNPTNESNSSTCDQGSSVIFGPISNLGQRTVNGLQGVYISAFDSAGNPQEFAVSATLLSAGIDVTFQTTAFAVFPCEGADDCGNGGGTPIVPPPNFNVYNEGPITYIDNDGQERTFNPTFTLGVPIFNINGELSIPFTLEINDPALNLNLEVNGEYNVTNNDINYPIENPREPGGGGDCNRPPTTITDETPPDPVPPPVPPDPELPTPEEEPERRIIAALVTVTSPIDDRIGKIFQGENPDVLIPDVGVINFLYQLGSTTTAWSEDIKIKNGRQLVPVPWSRGAVAVYGTPRPGVTWRINPIYESLIPAPSPQD